MNDPIASTIRPSGVFSTYNPMICDYMFAIF